MAYTGPYSTRSWEWCNLLFPISLMYKLYTMNFNYFHLQTLIYKYCLPFSSCLSYHYHWTQDNLYSKLLYKLRAGLVAWLSQAKWRLNRINCQSCSQLGPPAPTKFCAWAMRSSHSCRKGGEWVRERLEGLMNAWIKKSGWKTKDVPRVDLPRLPTNKK